MVLFAEKKYRKQMDCFENARNREIKKNNFRYQEKYPEQQHCKFKSSKIDRSKFEGV